MGNNILATRYVIQREDGQFYWKGHVSSQYGYTNDFSKAFLFETERGAKSRVYTAQPMKCCIKPVTITLGD